MSGWPSPWRSTRAADSNRKLAGSVCLSKRKMAGLVSLSSRMGSKDEPIKAREVFLHRDTSETGAGKDAGDCFALI